MSVFKINTRRVYLILSILLLISIATYFNFLSPQARAARHLAAVHEAVTEMHPAVLDKNAKSFHAWHAIAYGKAKVLLPKVHSVADENALLNFYFAGYEDAHLNGFVSQSPYTWMDFESARWTGWLTRATVTGFDVVMSLGGEKYPPVGAHLISCNKQPIDSFLKTNIAPFIDKRWHLLAARNKSAALLSLDVPNVHLLIRPTVSSCDFEAETGGIKSFQTQWSSVSAENEKEFAKIYSPGYEYPSVHEFAPKSYWVNVSDFQLNSAEAYRHHQELLSDLRALTDVDLIVFDTRMNNGGNSMLGDEILESFFGDERLYYLQQRLAGKAPDSEAVFRASWKFYWAYVFKYKQQRMRQGVDSTGLEFLEKILSRLKHALEHNQEIFLQSELGLENERGRSEFLKENNLHWRPKGKVVLLTSRNCFSSCLNFADTLKQVPELIHLGEPTNGDTIYTHIAETVSSYFREDYLFSVPIKAFTNRWRDDNQPHIPEVIYNGNIYTDPLEGWVREQVRQKQ